MDESQEGVLLIGTSMIVLVAFVLTVLAVMLIYRKRKIQHIHEIDLMNERFASELATAENEMQQSTMEQIGRELHDNIGQQLTLAFLYLQQFEASDADGEHKRNSASAILNESLNELRNVSRTLTDPLGTSVQLKLPELITRECNRIRESGKFDVVLQSGEIENDLSPAIKTFSFRIFQEFVQNSVRHSQGNRLDVSLQNSAKNLTLMIADNGVGFDQHETSTGSGLSNMKRRAEMIRADFDLVSEPGQGTKLKLSIALDTI